VSLTLKRDSARAEKTSMTTLRRRLASQAGFTLAELLVVVAIIGILSAVAVPVYMGFFHRADDTAAAANVRIAEIDTAGAAILAP
jgi:type IV pilus assembly protein PilA